MAYRFVADSTVEANVQRVFSEQLGKAVEQLSENFQKQPEQAVHNARKCLKKSRSLLRLVRKSIDKSIYQQESQRLRDVGRSLAPARDSAVYPATLSTLLDTYGLTLDVNSFSTLKTGLVDLYNVQLDNLSDREQFIAAVMTDLEASQTNLSQVALKQTGWKAVAKNLRHIYSQGQQNFDQAYNDGDDDDFHNWRKRVKDLWYCTCLLQSLWPPIMKAFESELHELADLLGDDHDIAALRQFLTHHAKEVGVKDVHMQVLVPLMGHRQTKLHRRAKTLGQKLYGETPKAFSDRMASYWHA
ncbi:CHAD domain-containing protein [Nodosilinea sp. E11]|uniref:CHAD domain-containing protein n=1 Tax=Nodosilinea sp. E11 TaxID=3037479 RepID=UPI0029342E55|nr:CHAD domain-containing protein [Nodosilinea sp. E11]WOD40220.1 CHAD domain-containing protein [Nodosilinea sp. E11]